MSIKTKTSIQKPVWLSAYGMSVLFLLGVTLFLALPTSAQTIVPNDIEFNSTGEWLAIAYSDGSISVLDTESLQPIVSREITNSQLVDIAWSPVTPDALAIVGANGIVTVFLDVTTNDWTGFALGTHGNYGFATAWSPDGTRLVIARQSDPTLIVDPTYDLQIRMANSGELLATLPLGRRLVASLDWQPNGSLIAYGKVDGTVRVFDPDQPTPSSSIIGEHQAAVHTLAWSPDGRLLATASKYQENVLRIWDVDQAAVVAEYSGTLVSDFDWSPDSQYIVVVDDGAIILIDAVSGTLLSTLEPASTNAYQVGWSSQQTIAYAGISVFGTFTLSYPAANANVDQVVVDADGNNVEIVTLDGSASTDPDGTIVNCSWTDESGTEIATGPTPTVDLPVGEHTITLTVESVPNLV